MTLLILGSAIVFLLIMRVPVAFALLLPCLVYVAGQSDGLSIQTVVNGIDSWPLLAVPLFILVGAMANRTGFAEQIFEFFLALIGRVRASLGYVNIGVSLGFSWMSGAALADAAGVGKIEVPAMLRHGYPQRFAVGITAASTLIGPVMPPSIPAVVYASLAAVSTGALFAASVIPALLLAFGLAVTVFIWARRHPELTGEKRSWRRLSRAIVGVIGPAIAPVIILGGILGGYFTPTEAAGVCAVYILVLGLVSGKLKFRQLGGVFREAMLTTASITLILGASALLGWILAREQVPMLVADAMLGISENPYVFLILVNLMLIVLGMIMEPTSAMVITVPILLPVATQVGIDPLHFGVVVILNLMIGLLTPPMGAVVFVLSSVTKISVDQVFRGAAPFLIPLLVVLLVVTFAPDLVLVLPALLGL